MRISNLEIVNIRAIHRIALEDIASVVLIAGPNGCGKSCIFDAIRLLKSCYGGYQPNEWHQWFGEYGININRRTVSLEHLFRDKAKPIVVSADFVLSSSERKYLQDNLESFALRLAWEIVAPHTQNYGIRPVARDIRAYESEVNRRADEIKIAVKQSLDKPIHRGRVEVSGNRIKTEPSPLLEVMFSAYEPEHLGIIDFHGANRVYQREDLAGINLNIESDDQKRRQSLLYNYGQKYTNIKSEMATSYVKGMLAERLGQPHDDSTSLIETLKELFRTFFPDKEFLGPVPTRDRALSFPVRMQGGIEYDINDLSSGEKEVLFGYLRLRNSSPRNSVILLDEPEMHLNPGLIKGLPQFYKRHIGEELGNQLWLVTHSDAFLREAAGQQGFDVFHMQHAAQAKTKGVDNQLTRVRLEEEIEQAVVYLVGDLATFKPGGPVLIFEGEESDFDVRMTCRLFPEVERVFNPISAGSKTNARKLHRLLRAAGARARLADRFFTVVDRDNDSPIDGVENVFTWPVYHIENFLLGREFVFSVLQDITSLARRFPSESDVEFALRESARSTIVDLVRHRLQNYANDQLVGSIRCESDRGKREVSQSLHYAISVSVQRIHEVLQRGLTLEELKQREDDETRRLEQSLQDGTWRSEFRGRDVLRRFLGDHCGGELKYPVFRDLIVGRMRDRGHRPEGMSTVISDLVSRAGGA